MCAIASCCYIDPHVLYVVAQHDGGCLKSVHYLHGAIYVAAAIHQLLCIFLAHPTTLVKQPVVLKRYVHLPQTILDERYHKLDWRLNPRLL